MDVSAFLRVFVQLFVTVLWLVVIARVLVSWIDPRFEGSVARFLYETTEPLMAPVRRVLPQTGMIDLSPLVVLLVLGVLARLVLIN